MILEVMGYGVGLLLGVYLFFRLIFAAWFRAKQQYEDNRYGQRTQQRTGS